MNNSFDYRREPLEDAFSSAAENYKGVLLNRARSLLKVGSRQNLPEDLMQEALCEMWVYVKREGMPPNLTEFNKWAHRVLDWKYKDLRKKEMANKRFGSLNNVSLDYDGFDRGLTDRHTSPINEASVREISFQLNSLIEKIKINEPSIARTIHLGIVCGYTSKEIEREQGISASTAAVRIFRFREEYRPLLTESLGL